MGRDANAGSPPPSRVQSVDALRGLVMIIMALDHTREFFHAGAMSFQPEDLTRTTAALFFTRWITHICAPVFMFTAGMGAFFWLRGGRTTGQARTTMQLSLFLWKRGLWLVLLELTVLRFAMNFSLTKGAVLLTILWALGWSMVALGFLVHVPVRWLTMLSVAWIALHNLADPIAAAQFGSHAWIWNILHQQGAFQLGGIQFLLAYPLVPWIFVMAAGFCFGRLIAPDSLKTTPDSSKRPSRNLSREKSPAPPRPERWTFRIGLGLTLAFLVIRAINIYGDPQPWSTENPDMMLLSFLKCTKYPPSLDFLLMTIGPALLLLAWFQRLTWSKTNPLIVFGRVPLFYFLIHFFVIHLLTIPFAFFRYGHAAFLLNPLPSVGGTMNLYPPDFGYPLWVVYMVWAAVVVMLYPLCLWFARFKERRSDWWLGYL
jgi:uncharacterized membrane protein